MAKIRVGMLQAKTVPKNPAPEMLRLRMYRSVCSKKIPAVANAIPAPIIPKKTEVSSMVMD